MFQVRQNLSEADRYAVSAQLDRMLANPLFKLSKRYPILLRHVVERALAGDTDNLKERSLGVEVFGRDPSYDTSTDPIVRTTAGEIRKRIAQYYQEDGHESEVRILLSPGSYVPEFSFPEAAEHAAEPAVDAPRPAGGRIPGWLGYALAALAGGALVAGAYRMTEAAPERTLHTYWGPLLNAQGEVKLCYGQRQFVGNDPEPHQEDTSELPKVMLKPGAPIVPATMFEIYYLGSQNVAVSDLEAIIRIAGLLDKAGKRYQLVGQRSATLTEFRGGPVILVGAFNNDWTKRLFRRFRFTCVREGNIMRIQDARRPDDRSMVVDGTQSYLDLKEDFAVISRVHDPITGSVVVGIAGLTGYGTAEAGEFLTREDALQKLAGAVPAGWEKKDVQCVLSTPVIRGYSGMPRVVACHVW